MLVLHSECPALKLLARGKVRDVYEVDEHTILFVATDRISAFDVAIEGKGKILTQISKFWFEFLKGTVPNHVITTDLNEMPAIVHQYKGQIEGRSMLVKKLRILPVEAIVRGYLSGSALVEYKSKGSVCDIILPSVQRRRWDPTMKTSIRANVIYEYDDVVPKLLGLDYARQVEALSLQIYIKARDYAQTKGIIIADTKFEFGVDENGTVVLADEVLTPDSSRFWPASEYKVGQSQPSFDKQYLRDYLLSINFDKKEGVELPELVVSNTVEKYSQVCKILTGQDPHW